MRYFGLVSYRGTDYAGFQKQANGKTIQGVMEETISFLLGKPTTIRASGRTDAKVHALRQPFTFDCPKMDDTAHFLYALNRLLPPDIYVFSLKEVDGAFDVRRDALSKTYAYRFSIYRRNPVLTDLVSQLNRDDFSLPLFNRALPLFKGTFDFRNFTTKPTDPKGFVRTVYSIDSSYEESTDTVEVVVKGDGFMRYQVRFMIGGAISVGLKRLTLEELSSRLHPDGKRKIVPYKASPEGLYLVEVDYDAEI